MFDYEVLRFIWWVLVGVLLIGFAVTDGFDMGVGILVRIIGKNRYRAPGDDQLHRPALGR
ncbi:Cytochrome d ubiquinol oxidase subunit 2 [Serratia marcescens]|uniref:Cytochrome d ubiquinol oxidase subunit 2 n=1 Tax=Serratia marcescens TaxID=615 RepID=A0A380AMQ7_SERMA|nr:Cytochrome d ubiquinol oxidase subunit 2 [Serratia marcescens]